jgi:hypothetical protein
MLARSCRGGTARVAYPSKSSGVLKKGGEKPRARKGTSVSTALTKIYKKAAQIAVNDAEPELPIVVRIAASIPPWSEIEKSPQFPTFSVEQKCLVADRYAAEALKFVAALPGTNVELEKQSLDQWASKMKERYRKPSK